MVAIDQSSLQRGSLYILSLTKKKPREAHLWQLDPSVFEPLRKAGLLERYVISRAKSFGKHTLYVLAFAYPLLLVTAGVMFGGIVFWKPRRLNDSCRTHHKESRLLKQL
jgi:hypothetical protein